MQLAKKHIVMVSRAALCTATAVRVVVFAFVPLPNTLHPGPGGAWHHQGGAARAHQS